ncbi:MAG: hypothetical protein FWG64_04735 [Firmicutes bacterium]|nr:hypothetical protein [Bacillota bacterium]
MNYYEKEIGFCDACGSHELLTPNYYWGFTDSDDVSVKVLLCKDCKLIAPYRCSYCGKYFFDNKGFWPFDDKDCICFECNDVHKIVGR